MFLYEPHCYLSLSQWKLRWLNKLTDADFSYRQQTYPLSFLVHFFPFVFFLGEIGNLGGFTPRGVQGLPPAQHSGITSDRLWGLYGLLGSKSGSVTCKASALHAPFWPCFCFIIYEFHFFNFLLFTCSLLFLLWHHIQWFLSLAGCNRLAYGSWDSIWGFINARQGFIVHPHFTII